MKRAALLFLQAMLLLACVLSPARATDPDTFSPVVSYQYQNSLTESGTPMTITSPVVSYQYLNSLAEPGIATTITSPVVSYQYFDWPGDENLTFANSPHVSYYFNGTPQILTQPFAQVRKAGQTATFTVSALGSTALAYQWRINGVNIPSANGAGIAIDNLQPSDSGAYSVVVSNAYGSVASNDAKLTVYFGPIAPQPTTPTQIPATQSISTAQTTNSPPPVSAQLRWFNAATNSFENVPQPLPAGKMAIVLTHGWKNGSDAPYWPIYMARALAPTYGATANIFAWDWHGDAGLTTVDPAPVAARTFAQGSALGVALMDTLGPTYDKNIHFAGHSFGTAVNCTAANYIHGDKRPRGDTRSSTQKYASYKTHMTLFDEAELSTAAKGLHVVLDIPLAGFDDIVLHDAVEQLNNFRVEVIPKQWGWIDNYVSEVGFLHPEAVNVMLWRKNYVNVAFDPHGYAYEWYEDTIANPGVSLVGHRWSFERNTLFQGPTAPSYYLQSLNLNASEMTVGKINVVEAEALSWGRVVAYPTLKAAQGMDATGTYIQKQLGAAGNYVYEKTNAFSTKVGAAYLDGIQYAGNMLANFEEQFSAPKGTPVFVGTSQSTAAYILSPEQTASGQQANWSLNFSIQPGPTQAQQLKVPMLAKAVANSAPNAVYTIIPIHVPNEAVGLSFEYKMAGAATEDFMTMGIGTANNYTMEAKYVDDGQWNGTPVIQVSDLHNQDVQLVFALNGASGPPTGTLSVRNVQFYIPPRPKMELQMARPQLTVSWPLSAVDWTLESTTDLSNPNGWQPVNAAPVDTDYFHTQTFDITPSNKAFFRLRK